MPRGRVEGRLGGGDERGRNTWENDHEKVNQSKPKLIIIEIRKKK